MSPLTTRSSGPSCLCACAPRAPGCIVRPRRAASVIARPLNASVRGHGPLSNCRCRRVLLGGGAVLWVASNRLQPRPASSWMDYWLGSASACWGAMVSTSMVKMGGVSARCPLHLPICLHYHHKGPPSLHHARGGLRGSPCRAAVSYDGGLGGIVCAMASNYAFGRSVKRLGWRAVNVIGYCAPKPRIMRQRAAAQRGR